MLKLKNKISSAADILLPRPQGLCVSGHVVRASFFDSDISLRRPGKATYRDETTAVVWIELLVLIGAQNMTSFHLEQTINERIHPLGKQKLKGKKKYRARRWLSPIWDLQKEVFIITLTYSVTTLQACGHLTVAGVLWQWKIAPSSLLYFSMEVTKLLFHLLRKMG